ncbi:MAG: cation:proton antiporter [Candidatus Competibacteraceae bacterium]
MILTSWFLVVGTLLIFMALASSLLKRLPLSTATLYLFVGFALGPTGAGLLLLDPIGQSAILKIIAEIAVIISLFSAGLKLRLPLTDRRWWLPIRLGTLGMFLTIVLITPLAIFMLGLPLGVALMLAATLAPTDAVLASDVQVENVGDRDRVRLGLTGEAGLNDGFALPFFLLGLGLLGLYELGPNGWRWFAVDFIWGMVAGIASGWLLGSLVGRLVVYLRRVHHEATGLEEFIALGLIALSYGFALLCEGNGFLAVFTAGVALRRTEHRASGEKRPEQVVGTIQIGKELEIAIDPQKAPAYMAHAVLSFNDQLERIAEVAIVLLVGGMLSMGYLSLEAIVVAPVLFLIIRPLAVILSLIGSRTPAVQRNLMAWFGIRGIGSIYYVLAAVEYGLPEELVHRLLALVLTLVAISVIIHGISATPLMELYRRWRPQPELH